MATDLRILTFSLEEVSRALYSYARKAGVDVPEGLITSIEMPKEKDSEVIVNYRDDNERMDLFLKLKPDLIMSCLIEQCKEEGMPIPELSSKSLDLIGNNLSLCLRSENVGSSS